MKKIYEAPEMLVEVVCVEELLTASTISIMESDTKISDDNDFTLLGKDRNESDWGNLW